MRQENLRLFAGSCCLVLSYAASAKPIFIEENTSVFIEEKPLPGPKPVIEVVEPHGDQSILVGKPIDIRWTTRLPGSAKNWTVFVGYHYPNACDGQAEMDTLFTHPAVGDPGHFRWVPTWQEFYWFDHPENYDFSEAEPLAIRVCAYRTDDELDQDEMVAMWTACKAAPIKELVCEENKGTLRVSVKDQPRR